MAIDPNSIGNFADLVKLLEKDGVLHKTDLAEQTVQIPTQRGELDSVLLMRWQDSDGVVQFIQALPIEVPADKLLIVSDAVTRLNHALAIPGFDLNHQHGLVAYRLYLPIYPRGSVRPNEVQAMFRLTVKTAADFFPTIRRIIAGEIQPEAIVDEAKKAWEAAAAAAAQAAKPPTGSPPAGNGQTPPGANMY
ncbi:MAG: YbjN domain-containing protein [Myxococcales bacterium]|nr:YbjN domain-containing protein [Myxococcales bacterium]